jgi:hypothetical protein
VTNTPQQIKRGGTCSCVSCAFVRVCVAVFPLSAVDVGGWLQLGVSIETQLEPYIVVLEVLQELDLPENAPGRGDRTHTYSSRATE